MFHRSRFPFQEIVDKFHEIFFTLEPRKIGQRLQRFRNQRKVSRSFLIWIF